MPPREYVNQAEHVNSTQNNTGQRLSPEQAAEAAEYRILEKEKSGQKVTPTTESFLYNLYQTPDGYVEAREILRRKQTAQAGAAAKARVQEQTWQDKERRRILHQAHGLKCECSQGFVSEQCERPPTKLTMRAIPTTEEIWEGEIDPKRKFREKVKWNKPADPDDRFRSLYIQVLNETKSVNELDWVTSLGGKLLESLSDVCSVMGPDWDVETVQGIRDRLEIRFQRKFEQYGPAMWNNTALRGLSRDLFRDAINMQHRKLFAKVRG